VLKYQLVADLDEILNSLKYILYGYDQLVSMVKLKKYAITTVYNVQL